MEIPKILVTVDDCINFSQLLMAQGRHCYNCARRNGYPGDYGQPSCLCENAQISGGTPSAESDCSAGGKQ